MLFSDDEGGSEAGASSLLTGTDEAAGTAMALGEQPQGRMASGALGSVEAGPRASQKTIAVSEMGDIEMESWEFAPGRLMDASGSESEQWQKMTLRLRAVTGADIYNSFKISPFLARI